LPNETLTYYIETLISSLLHWRIKHGGNMFVLDYPSVLCSSSLFFNPSQIAENWFASDDLAALMSSNGKDAHLTIQYIEENMLEHVDLTHEI
jgi:hypothetical protein